mmetsp:Transcript_18241/g.69033  ORF Transcript_18241/g.69033 Transcript_18241/m.69033 type:complete len:237 (-) Transcript_18241:738-1448(-)
MSSSSMARVHSALERCAAARRAADTAEGSPPSASATARAIHGSGMRPRRGEDAAQRAADASGLNSSRASASASSSGREATSGEARSLPAASGGDHVEGSESGFQTPPAAPAPAAELLTSTGQKSGVAKTARAACAEAAISSACCSWMGGKRRSAAPAAEESRASADRPMEAKAVRSGASEAEKYCGQASTELTSASTAGLNGASGVRRKRTMAPSMSPVWSAPARSVASGRASLTR